LCWWFIARVYNIYREESILLPYNPVESCSVKLRRNNICCVSWRLRSTRNARINNTNSDIASSIYEEMEVFDDEFYVEPSPDSKESSRKKCWTFIKKTGQAPCSVASVSNRFINDIMFNWWHHWLYRKNRTNLEIFRHNFTLRDSTGLYGSRILSSLYIL